MMSDLLAFGVGALRDFSTRAYNDDPAIKTVKYSSDVVENDIFNN